MKQFSKDLGNVSLAPRGKWSKEQEYERLSLVYNVYDNFSYIAKINVPIGVEIDNREYWQPINATGYADNNFINLTAESETGTVTAYESLEEAVATILPINRRAGAIFSFFNLNSDRLDRKAEFELWQFNSTDLANWENRDYWNNIYYNWNVFVGWYVGADGLENHVKIPNVGQYAYVGTNLNDALLYQCRTNGVWTNTGIKVRNYISVVVSGNITIGDNGNWFSDGKDTGIPATPAVDEQLDNIIMQLQQYTIEISNLKKSNANLQDQITSNDSDINSLTAKHESLSKTVQGIAATGGASTATNVTYDKTNSGLNAENVQDAITEIQNKTLKKSNIVKNIGNSENDVISQKTATENYYDLQNIGYVPYANRNIIIASNTEHSSNYDKLYININKDEIVLITYSGDIDMTKVKTYAYYKDNTNELITNVVDNIVKFKAKKDILGIGIYYNNKTVNNDISLNMKIKNLSYKISSHLSLCNVYTRGYLNINNDNKTITFTENAIVYINNINTVTIPKNTIINYNNINYENTTLYCIVVNTISANVTIEAYNSSNIYDNNVIAIFYVNKNNIEDVYSSSIKVRYNNIQLNRHLSLATVYTKGNLFVDIDNKEIKLTKNTIVYLNNENNITINKNTKVSYKDLSILDTSLYSIAVDITNKSIYIVPYNKSTNKIIIATFDMTSLGILNKISSCSMNVVYSSYIKNQNNIYKGSKILFNKCNYKRFLSESFWYSQSIAIYNQYAILCNSDEQNILSIKIGNISNNTLEKTIQNIQYDGNNVIAHANTCCFGNKYNDDDIFPLLYVSSWSYTGDREVYVLRFIGDTINSLIAQVIQVINPKNINKNIIGNGSCDWIVDTDNNKLYALSYKLSGNSGIIENNMEMIVVFDLPNFETTKLYLSDNDIVEHYTLNTFNYSQDKFYNNNRIFILTGLGTSTPNYNKLIVLDLNKKEITTEINLNIPFEPEGIDLYLGNKILFNFDNDLYQLNV